ncbi:MAG TPA: DUF1559 domain-containing protein, partial [Pirellulales bacterium]
AGLATRPAVFVCPQNGSTLPTYDTGTQATGSYAVCAGSFGPTYGISDQVKITNNGMFLYKTVMKVAQCTDGLSNTFMVGEVIEGHKPASDNRWTLAGRHAASLRTTDNPLNTPVTKGVVQGSGTTAQNGAFASDHPGGGQFVLGDGRVTFISEDIDLRIYRALGTRAGNEAETGKTD